MLFRISSMLVLCGGVVVFSSVAVAETAATPPQGQERPARPGPTLQIYFENDLFCDTDRYYTNAVQMRLISPDLNSPDENAMLPDGMSRLLNDVPFPGSDDAVQYNLSLGFGQQIYTPSDTQMVDPPDGERPYAGYLYGFLALHAKQYSRLDTLELAVGMIGPSALGEQAQNEVHRIRDMDTAKGWDTQLHDEPTAMLTWTRTWRLNEACEGLGWDVLPHFGLSAGTPFTQASLGGEVRFGWNLPSDFGTSTIRPGSGINAPSRDDMERRRNGAFWENFSLYMFAGADGRAVAWNSSLDGNIWKDGRSVDKYPFVGDLTGGLGVCLYDFSLTYTHVYRSLEFHGQDEGQSFGSITMGYIF